MTRHHRSPHRATHAIESVLEELAPQTLLAAAQGAWPQAVGATIASEAQPTAERGGVLTISCTASVWAQELDLMGPAILERLNALLRCGQVSRLRCVAVPV
ncbi:MAG: DUF721 domain-containing protein [Actinomycetota bacterium]|nr:DUF721 domain-containing protein [Actinomycetota bacterium]